MQYQKYRNQGGTMSYQQFKMAILKQAQQQGPMAQQQSQAQPQMMSRGGRTGFYPGGPAGGASAGGNYGGDSSGGDYQGAGAGRSVAQGGQFGNSYDDYGWIPSGTVGGTNLATDTLQSNVVAQPNTIDKIRNFSLYSALTEPFKDERGIYKSDEEEDVGMVTSGYDTKLDEKNAADIWKEFKKTGGRVGLLGGGPVPGSHVAGYTTPAAYNKFDYPSGGVRVAAANGGIMPLLDLGGKEKDYRQDGGFVGIGRKEKADDVPARLSKNEFVFTADAVRNAGGGDIDAGAEVMDNMMKHLESGGQISEESQGIGAQGMYDNMRQLETRIE